MVAMPRGPSSGRAARAQPRRKMVSTMTTHIDTDMPSDPDVTDESATFGGRLFDCMVAASTILLVDVAHRAGLFEILVDGGGTSDQLAACAGFSERQTRELLNGLATAEVLRYDAATRAYSLPSAHAACLTGDGPANYAPTTSAIAFCARHVEAVVSTLRHGGGIPYSEYRPEFTGLMDDSMRRVYDAKLLDGYVPAVPGLAERL